MLCLNFRSSRAFLCFGLFCSFVISLLPLTLSAQTFDVGASKPNEYLLGFVAINNVKHQTNRYNVKFGADAHNPSQLHAHSSLYVLHPQANDPIKIFPLPSHFNQGLIDAEPEKGAVTEPNATLDGESLLVTYFHDFTRKRVTNEESTQGADIYKIDLGPLKNNPSFSPENLTITRLTTQPEDVNQDALNKGFADAMAHPWGKPQHMHAIEILTELGLRVVYVSDKRHVLNSNFSNKNQFNIFIAQYGPNGKLIDDNQFQYYTTTSAISPTNLRDGFSFSYHANTEGSLNWEIQQINSSGKWAPLQGYGHAGSGRTAFHNGTLCRTSDPRGDVWMGNAYYASNNNGFGGIIGLEMSKATQNVRFTNNGRGFPVQYRSFDYTLDVEWNQDEPSLTTSGSRCNATTAASGSCLGKFTTPRCGKTDELFLSWSPTYANNKNGPGGWEVGSHPPLYDAKIVFRSDLWTPASVNNPANWPTVVDDTSGQYSLLWPTPVLSHFERFGEAPKFSKHITPLDNHLPVAQVGTSSLYHTDIVPYECRYNENYSPHTMNGSRRSAYYESLASLSYLRDSDPANRDSVCEDPVLPVNVFGVAINLTDNNTDYRRFSPINKRKEKTKRLCVRQTANQVANDQDHSFLAHIPSNVPFEFHLLHRRYALRMADVRSWHSLKPGEKRTDCGGCHQHGHDKPPISYEDKLANQPSYETEDCVTKTSVIEYDASCNPQIVVKNTPAEPVPMMGDNTPLFQGLVNNCSGCHSAGNPAANAFIVHTTGNGTQGPAERTIEDMKAKRYLNRYDGALGSPAFWAARGERTDGRDNSEYNKASHFYYSSEHDNLDLCAAEDNWVYLFGLWIDNLMPVEYFYTWQSHDVDTFHPSVSFGLADSTSCNLAEGLMVGTWDDTGSVESLDIELNDQQVLLLTNAPNGSHDATSVVPANNTDRVKVTVTDAQGNRQSYVASVDQLLHECTNPNSNGGAFGGFGATPTPSPSPSGSPTPPPGSSPTPSPTPGIGGPDDPGNPSTLGTKLQELQSQFNKLKRKIRKLKKRRKRYRSTGRSTAKLTKRLKRKRVLLRTVKQEISILIEQIDSMTA